MFLTDAQHKALDALADRNDRVKVIGRDGEAVLLRYPSGQKRKCHASGRIR